MAELLKGAAVVAAMNERLTAEVAALKEKGVTPTLAILRVGEREDDISYEKGAMKRCDTVGVAEERHSPRRRLSGRAHEERRP